AMPPFRRSAAWTSWANEVRGPRGSRAEERFSIEMACGSLSIMKKEGDALLPHKSNLLLDRCPRLRFRADLLAQLQVEVLLGALLVALIGIDDALHQVMADDVLFGEMREPDPLHAFQNVERVHQTALLGVWQVDLRDVARDHRF